jgi:4-amino-4-deoxy-L-arabinose transferase-like glycosyltransferase
LIAAYGAIGMAVLAKGLIGGVIPALAVVSYAAVTGNIRIAVASFSLPGIGLALAIAAPWFILVQRANPEFLHFFFVEEHLNRYVHAGHHRLGPWWYYVPIITFGSLPWTPAWLYRLPTAVRALGGGGLSKQFSPALFCATWVVCVMAFFSTSSSKLPAYVVPSFPALALLLGFAMRDLDPRPVRVSCACNAVLGVTLVALVSRLPEWSKFAEIGRDADVALPWLYGAATCVLFGSLVAWWAASRGWVRTAIAILAISAFAMWNCAFAFLHEVDDHFSTERLIEGIVGEEPMSFHPELRFYSILRFDHSVPFYLERPVTLVGFKDELAPGIQLEPDKFIPNVDDFEAAWRDEPDGFAIMSREQFSRFVQHGLPMHEVASDPRYIVVRRR